MPGAMVLNASGKGFELTVDPTGLPEGCHFAEVLGRDAKKAERGPVLRLPITVIVPRKVPAGDWRLPVVGRTYLPGALDRHFIDVPAGATWASVSFRTKELEGAHMLVVHALQARLSPARLPRHPLTHAVSILVVERGGSWSRDLHERGAARRRSSLACPAPGTTAASSKSTSASSPTPRWSRRSRRAPSRRLADPPGPPRAPLRAAPASRAPVSPSTARRPRQISCVGGLTLEICICKWWASLGAAAVDIEVTFHGLPTSASAICVSSGAPAQLEFGAPLRAETSAVRRAAPRRLPPSARSVGETVRFNLIATTGSLTTRCGGAHGARCAQVSCKLTHLQKTFRPTSNVRRPPRLREDVHPVVDPGRVRFVKLWIQDVFGL